MCIHRLRLLTVLVAFCLNHLSWAQSYTWDNFVQEYTEGILTGDDEEETAYEAVTDGALQQWDVQMQELRLLHDNPMNINTATREELLRLPFLDEEQVEEIHAYVYLHGFIQTQGELRLVPLLDSRTRRFLSLFVTYGADPEKTEKKHKLFMPIKNSLTTRLDVPLYYRKGYQLSLIHI